MPKKNKTISLAFFNNKGGVGKTTLSCNMAAMLAKKIRGRLLYVDCDPQCNATQLLLQDSHWTKIFSNRRQSASQTILAPLRHIRAGDSSVDSNIPIRESSRFGIDVLPGHPGLSIVEDSFSSSWVEFKGGDNIGAARRTLWMRSLVSLLDYECIVFDMGPSLGPLNRTVLLGSDFFVTPMSADLFSLYALDNISEWMKGWVFAYELAIKGLHSKFPDELAALPFLVAPLPQVSSGYAGYSVQQYVTRTSGSEIRKVRAYDRYRKRIPERVKSLMRWAVSAEMKAELGIVPNMFSMVPLAQSAHAPIIDLKAADGLRGAQLSQNRKYSDQLEAIANRLAENIGIETGKPSARGGSREKSSTRAKKKSSARAKKKGQSLKTGAPR